MGRTTETTGSSPVARSHRARPSPKRWETDRIAVPEPRSERAAVNSRCTSTPDSAAAGPSTTRTRRCRRARGHGVLPDGSELSAATVSNVLNRPERVAEATRLRVEQAIRELDYVCDSSGRSLRAGCSDSVGLLVPDVTNPFFTTVALGVEDQAAEYGLTAELGREPRAAAAVAARAGRAPRGRGRGAAGRRRLHRPAVAAGARHPVGAAGPRRRRDRGGQQRVRGPPRRRPDRRTPPGRPRTRADRVRERAAGAGAVPHPPGRAA